MKTLLAHSDYLTLLDDDQRPVHGCNQDWYPTTWQRKAGCGPTTATNLLIYHQRAGRVRVQDSLQTTRDGQRLMQRVWHYVKPSAMGVHTPGIFHHGLQKLFRELAVENAHNGKDLTPLSLVIPRQRALRPSLSAMAAFIRDGITNDSPVAFLNLHNGSIRRLDRWHWVTVTGITENSSTQVELEICDNLQHFTVDLKEWSETTTLGGGFVYLRKP